MCNIHHSLLWSGHALDLGRFARALYRPSPPSLFLLLDLLRWPISIDLLLIGQYCTLGLKHSGQLRSDVVHILICAYPGVIDLIPETAAAPDSVRGSCFCCLHGVASVHDRQFIQRVTCLLSLRYRAPWGCPLHVWMWQPGCGTVGQRAAVAAFLIGLQARRRSWTLKKKRNTTLRV